MHSTFLRTKCNMNHHNPALVLLSCNLTLKVCEEGERHQDISILLHFNRIFFPLFFYSLTRNQKDILVKNKQLCVHFSPNNLLQFGFLWQKIIYHGHASLQHFGHQWQLEAFSLMQIKLALFDYPNLPSQFFQKYRQHHY